jgi:hypothetical protein
MSKKTWLAAPHRNYRERRLILIFWLIAVILGAFFAWDGRHAMDPDGISYLDMGEAYLGGDWKMAVNSHWSPLYSWLLGLAMVVLKPSPYWEFSVAHLVNFGIYLLTLGSFHFFLLELLRYNRSQRANFSGNGGVALPDWAWIALGYTLFIWTTLNLITISLVTPDMLVAAFVYLSSAMLLRIRTGSASWQIFILLGLVLGFGFLAKSPMLPLGLVFLGVSMFSVGNFRIAVPRVLIALLVFVLVAGPHVVVLSKTKGRLTVGDTARLAYAWWVNGVTYGVHWQGEPSGSGTPQHPTRKIFDAPPIYEFATPIGGTYPPWYDPSYWYEGVVARFDLTGQIKALKENAQIVLEIFRDSGLIVGCLILYLVGGRKWSCIKDIAKHWTLHIPAIAAFMMYSLTCVRSRYMGAFIVLLWTGVFSGLRLRDSPDSKRLVECATAAMLTVMMITIAFSPVLTALSKAGQLIDGKNPWPHPHYQVAEGLNRMGIGSGDKVASLGTSFKAYWARLARVKIVAEIPSSHVADFWEADSSVRSQAIEAFVTTGAKVIVTRRVPNPASTHDWQRIGNTGHYAYVLPPS